MNNSLIEMRKKETNSEILSIFSFGQIQTFEFFLKILHKFLFLFLQITFNLHSLRWRKSQNYSRLGLFTLIFLFCVPYNTYSLYCYLTPKVLIQNSPEGVSMSQTQASSVNKIRLLENKLLLFACFQIKDVKIK